MQLRPYQTELIDKTRTLMCEGCHSIQIQSATGSGKTLLTAWMLKSAAQKGMASWFIVHRRELIKQSIQAFGEVGVPHGVIANGFMEDPRHPVQIASIQTLARRYERFKKPRLLVLDESHHCPAGTWSKIINAFPSSYRIGLSATPVRLDGQGLSKYFQKMIHGPSVQWLIENGFLSRYKLYAPPGINTTGIKSRMGDFAQDILSKAADKPSITGDAIKHYLKLAPGKRAVVFCCSIEHSKHVVAQFNSSGIKAEHIDGETETEVRDAAVKRFQKGETTILSNVELFGEGFDLPALEVAILLRPTQSLGLYLQQIGRSLRPDTGKSNALILDHAGNCQRHGLPDEERNWTLEGTKNGNGQKNNGQLVKICPQCYAAQPTGSSNCKFCGILFEIKSRKVERREGDLIEIDPELYRRQRKTEQGRADTFEQLVSLGRARGYRRPYFWAKHILNARQRIKLRRIK